MTAYRDALATNPDLQISERGLQATRENRYQARAGLLPQVSASAGITRSYNTDNGAVNDAASNTRHSVSTTLNQPLFNQPANVAIKLSKPQIAQAEADLDIARQDLILNVAQSYFNVLRAQDDLTFQTTDQAAIAEQLEQAKQQFEVGIITSTDVLEAQSRYDQSVADVVEARNNLSDAKEALRQVTGKYYPTQSRLNPTYPMGKIRPNNPEKWVQMALENNPSLRSDRLKSEQSRLNIDLQRAGHLPTVSASAGYSNSGSEQGNNNAASLGLSMNLPIYSGGSVTSKTRQAGYQYAASQSQVVSTRRSVEKTVRDAFRGLETARQTNRALQQAVVSNRGSLEAIKASYEVGTRTIVDVLNAQSSYFQAQRDLSTSRYDFIINQLQLQHAIGRLSERQIKSVNRWLTK